MKDPSSEVLFEVKVKGKLHKKRGKGFFEDMLFIVPQSLFGTRTKPKLLMICSICFIWFMVCHIWDSGHFK